MKSFFFVSRQATCFFMLLSIFNTLIGKHITFCDDYLSLIVRMHCFILSSMEMKFNITWWSCSGLEIGIKGKIIPIHDIFFFYRIRERRGFKQVPPALNIFQIPKKMFSSKACWRKGNWKKHKHDWTVCAWHYVECFVCTVLFSLHLTPQVIYHQCCLEDDMSQANDISTFPFLQWHTTIF